MKMFPVDNNGWVRIRVGDILELKYGKALPEKIRDGSGYPVYGSNGIVGFHSDCLVKSQGIIIGRKGSYGVVNLSNTSFSPIDTTYYIDELSNLPIKFLFYLLSYLPLKELNRSTAIPGLNREDAYAQPIGLPPLAEQKEIANRLDKLLAQVEATQAHLARISDIIKRFRQSVLSAAVSGELTEDWHIKHADTPWLDGVLGDFINKPSYGSSAKSDKDGLVPVLRMGNLQNGKLDWTDLVYTSNEVEIGKYKLSTGDVLFNRTNSPELVGKTSIYRGERAAIYAGYLIKISCLPVLNPEFLNYHLNSPSARAYCYAVKSDGVSQSNINAKKLAEYPMSLPQPAEQTEIVRRVEQLFAYADTIEQQAKAAKARVDNLTQAILAKAFRGELTADWRAANPHLISGDNSAAALLARIQAERLPMVGKRKSAR